MTDLSKDKRFENGGSGKNSSSQYLSSKLELSLSRQITSLGYT